VIKRVVVIRVRERVMSSLVIKYMKEEINRLIKRRD
jgi:hypothetical protein